MATFFRDALLVQLDPPTAYVTVQNTCKTGRGLPFITRHRGSNTVIVRGGWGLHELRPVRVSLEDIFLSLTTEEVAAAGGEVVIAPLVPGRSTTSILQRGGREPSDGGSSGEEHGASASTRTS